MRSTLISLTSFGVVSLGLLAPGCGDDTGSDSTSTTTSPMETSSTTSDPSTTVADPDSTGGTADSGTETDAVDSSGSTGPSFECGDDVVEGDEVCDGAGLGEEDCLSQGFDGGDLACMADCSGYDTRGCLLAVCGDGVAVGDELCDGRDTAGATCETEGFDSGALLCTEDCASFDTSGCGVCGNNQVDGSEACDDVWLQGEDCISQGFDSGTIGCAADCLTYDTSGCGLCGNDMVDGEEVCDGVDTAGVTCNSLGFAALGNPGCSAICDAIDVYACDVLQYDVATPVTASFPVSNRFRGNGYVADGDGVLVDFGMYLDLPAACDLDFYVYESAMPTGALTQLARTTVNAGPGTDYYMAGLPLVPVTAGMYYALGVGFNCTATYFYDGSGAEVGVDDGIGIANNNRWDNGYPGPSDMYAPPSIGNNLIYVQRVFFGD